jgi:hypothetical protein
MRSVLQDFRDSIARIRDVADDITAEAPSALSDPAVRRRHETIQFASTVILSGYFESFLRDLARAYIRDISRLALPFAGLPAVVRHSHFEYGGQVLANVAKAERKGAPSRFPTNTADIAARLHSVGQAVPYNLVWEAFADTGANPGPLVVGDYLRRMGVAKVWPTLGLKTTASAAHQTETWLTVNLESFIAVRNECAHGGSASVQVLPSDLKRYCDLLEVLGAAMVAVLEDVRQGLAPPTPQLPVPTTGATPALPAAPVATLPTQGTVSSTATAPAPAAATAATDPTSDGQSEGA